MGISIDTMNTMSSAASLDLLSRDDDCSTCAPSPAFSSGATHGGGDPSHLPTLMDWKFLTQKHGGRSILNTKIPKVCLGSNLIHICIYLCS